MSKDLQVGDTVRLINRIQREEKAFGTAKIEMFYADIPGGLRLDKYLGDFRSWNEKDVQRVKKARLK